MGYFQGHFSPLELCFGVCSVIIFNLIFVMLLFQRCNHCNRFGASVVCQIPRCGKTYHYPCAASSGSFQVCQTKALNHLATTADTFLRNS